MPPKRKLDLETEETTESACVCVFELRGHAGMEGERVKEEGTDKRVNVGREEEGTVEEEVGKLCSVLKLAFKSEVFGRNKEKETVRGFLGEWRDGEERWRLRREKE